MKRDAMERLREVIAENTEWNGRKFTRRRAEILRAVRALLRERADAACQAFLDGPRADYYDECRAIRNAVLKGGK